MHVWGAPAHTGAEGWLWLGLGVLRLEPDWGVLGFWFEFGFVIGTSGWGSPLLGRPRPPSLKAPALAPAPASQPQLQLQPQPPF